jgi:hypothetical protein
VYRSRKHSQPDRYTFEKLSLLIPDNGLAPIFRLRQFSEPILITKEACKEAKKQGIKGLRLFNFPAWSSDGIEDFFKDYYKDDEE